MTPRAITATQRYRWGLSIGDAASEEVYARRAADALAAITEDVQAMTVVIPFPAGLRFTSPSDDEVPTRLALTGAGLAQNLRAAVVLEEPVDPWAGQTMHWGA